MKQEELDRVGATQSKQDQGKVDSNYEMRERARWKRWVRKKWTIRGDGKADGMEWGKEDQMVRENGSEDEIGVRWTRNIR